MGVTEAYPSPLPSLLLLLPWPLSGHCYCDCRPESSGVLEEDSLSLSLTHTHSLSLSLSISSPSLLKNRTEEAELHISSRGAQISPGRTRREDESWHKRCVKTRAKRTFKNNREAPAFISFFLPRHVGSVFVPSVDLALQSRSGLCSQGFSRSCLRSGRAR